jgi:large subunit ribosomal protein L6
MSRVAKKLVLLPAGVEVVFDGHVLIVKSAKAEQSLMIPVGVSLDIQSDTVSVSGTTGSLALAGTIRSLIYNMVVGVTVGFKKKLQLVGVGYKASVDKFGLNLALGFSHPVVHVLPDDIKAEVPIATEIIISGPSKQQVGQVAADIRAYRPPEPYKGKGVRYDGEKVAIKAVNKKK